MKLFDNISNFYFSPTEPIIDAVEGLNTISSAEKNVYLNNLNKRVQQKVKQKQRLIGLKKLSIVVGAVILLSSAIGYYSLSTSETVINSPITKAESIVNPNTVVQFETPSTSIEQAEIKKLEYNKLTINNSATPAFGNDVVIIPFKEENITPIYSENEYTETFSEQENTEMALEEIDNLLKIKNTIHAIDDNEQKALEMASNIENNFWAAKSKWISKYENKSLTAVKYHKNKERVKKAYKPKSMYYNSPNSAGTLKAPKLGIDKANDKHLLVHARKAYYDNDFPQVKLLLSKIKKKKKYSTVIEQYEQMIAVKQGRTL